jgi:hypothetical protein
MTNAERRAVVTDALNAHADPGASAAVIERLAHFPPDIADDAYLDAIADAVRAVWQGKVDNAIRALAQAQRDTAVLHAWMLPCLPNIH